MATRVWISRSPDPILSVANSFRVLFVCLGNICRSPAAENIFRHRLDETGLSRRVSCDSAGTISLQKGKPPNSQMARLLQRRGYPVTGTARMIKSADLRGFDLILTMDHSNEEDVLALARTTEEKSKVRSLTDFCRSLDHDEVPDPYGGADKEFELAVELIEDAVDGLIDHLNSEPVNP